MNPERYPEDEEDSRLQAVLVKWRDAYPGLYINPHTKSQAHCLTKLLKAAGIRLQFDPSRP